MNLMPPLLLPAWPAAVPLYNRHRGVALNLGGTGHLPAQADVDSQVSRNTCMVALSAVGRANWDNRGGLEQARAGIYDWSIVVNCYSSVLVWAVVAGAINGVEQNRYVARIAAAKKEIGGANAVAKQILWDEVGKNGANRSQYVAGADMPLAAMVYFGRGDENPIYHVGVHVGEGFVVGACMPVHDHPEAMKLVDRMLDAKLSAFTTMMTVSHLANNDFRHVFYTRRPFWQTFPT